ncbi:MAG: GNAT family N-acetyltransferase [Ferruginibacter sp.]
MAIKQIDHGSKEYSQMIQLRRLILRHPLGLEFSPEELEKEKNDILIGAFEEDTMLGCCVLSPQENESFRLRQMAVGSRLQRKGMGASIIAFAENLARDKGGKKITMHARNTVIGFYEKFGYKTFGDEFYEVTLPHHIMEKNL